MAMLTIKQMSWAEKLQMFYARLDQRLGEYFLNSLFGDIDFLAHI